MINSEKKIERTIQSVLSQSYNNIEYIIIDGGSTDGTLDIVNKYKNKVSYIISERDNGIYDAFNKGFYGWINWFCKFRWLSIARCNEYFMWIF